MRYLLKSLLLLALAFPIFAAPQAQLWPYFSQHDAQSQIRVSHQVWQQFLDRYLRIQGSQHLVAYAQVSTADKQALQAYLQSLAKIDPRTLNRQQQYAYWVNLYNALTVDLILEHYPLASITKLGGWFSFGPWDQQLLSLAGKSLSLNDIEHRILRPIWQDPRTHYAVNCASLGCPNLQPQAFTAANTESLLDQAAYDFVNSDKGLALRGDKIVLSSIYEWFANDFGSSQGLQGHLQVYRPDLSFKGKSLSFDYDWRLNDFIP